MSNPRTAALSEAGVSIWLDDLSRELIDSGRLAQLVEESGVVGVTTNPTIFAAAIGSGRGYREALASCAERGLDAEAAAIELSCRDVADACDVLAEVYRASGGRDGRVSLEVSPALAHDAAATVAQARELWARVDRPNAMIKIPATEAGLEAITEVIAAGISVNVTLVFGLSRYRQVVGAYLTGLERARAAGLDLSRIHSVASVFVSRLDALIDPQLAQIGDEDALALRGRAGLANARLANEVAEQGFASERARLLIAAGANPQRPLWASTGTKDPELPDTLYVSGLVVAGSVNTMPPATLAAFADHGEVDGDTVSAEYRESDQVLNALDGLGIDYAESVARLEAEGLEKFLASWTALLDSVSEALGAAR
ncbi:MAG: transaldolase [Leucobacter sp.]